MCIVASVNSTVKPFFKGHCDEGTPCKKGTLRNVSYLPHVEAPVTRGHLSCRDSFSGILRCPLKTGFTVVYQVQLVSLSLMHILKFAIFVTCFNSHQLQVGNCTVAINCIRGGSSIWQWGGGGARC